MGRDQGPRCVPVVEKIPYQLDIFLWCILCMLCVLCMLYIPGHSTVVGILQRIHRAAIRRNKSYSSIPS